MARIFDFSVWIKKWAQQYHVPPIPVYITDELETGLDGYYDWERNRILVSQFMVEHAKKSSDALRVVKNIIAHEFGHYLLHRSIGVTPKDTEETRQAKLKAANIDQVASEKHAAAIAKKLSGLTEFDCMNLMDRFLDIPATIVLQSKCR